MSWIHLEHPETGGTTRVPAAEGVLEAHLARGWRRAPEPAPEPAPPPVVPETEWVLMRHPESGGLQEVPNDPDVVADQKSRGWVVDEPEQAPDDDGQGDNEDPGGKPSGKGKRRQPSAVTAEEK